MMLPMSERIGILTGGGDCPGLNAAIRAVVKHGIGTHGWEIVGIKDAFKGLVEKRTMPLTLDSVRGLLDKGGTILGSSNRAHPYHYPVIENGKEVIKDVSGIVLENMKELGLDGLIVVGGDGTMGIAHGLCNQGAKIVGIPKTIDNDLEATDATIGFQTSVDIATAAIDRLHTTAESHDRIIICEVMGRYAGWIAMHAGLSSGADVILIPEIQYDFEKVANALKTRHKNGKSYSIVVVAEGALPKDGKHATVKEGDPAEQDRLGGAGQKLAHDLAKATDFDIRVTVLGHVQRGGSPCSFDRLLATKFGAAAVDMVANKQFQQVVALKGGEITKVSMDLAAKKIKCVKPNGVVVKTAESLGVCVGR